MAVKAGARGVRIAPDANAIDDVLARAPDIAAGRLAPALAHSAKLHSGEGDNRGC